MSNPCPICGRLIEEQHAFCTYCGHPLGARTTAPAAVVSPMPAAQADDAVPAVIPRRKKKDHVGFLIGFGAVLVMLCIAAAVAAIFLGGDGEKLNSPQAVLDRLIDTVLDGDYDRAMDCIYEYHYSDALREAAREDIGDLPVESIESLGIDKDTIKSMLTLRVKHQEEVGPQDDEAIRKTLTENDVTTEPIDQIVRAEVEISMMGESESIDLFFIKADGGWYLLSSENSLLDSDTGLFE